MDWTQLNVKFRHTVDAALEWARSPEFYAQLALIAVAIALAWAVAGFIRSRASAGWNEDATARSAPLKRQLHHVWPLVLPLVLILTLRMAGDLSNAWVGESGLIRVARGMAIVYLLYSLIAGFVTNRLLKAFFKWVVIPVAILQAIGWLDDVTRYLDSINFEVGSMRISAYGVTRFIVFGSILFWLGRVSNVAGQQIIRRQEDIDAGAREVAAKIFQIAVFIVVALMLLQLMSIDITTLAVFGGAVGIGIGFGLQAIASNFISGLIILLDRSVTAGDYIELEDGVSGTIRQLNMRSTLLETFDGKDIMVPNSTFISSRFANWTHQHRKQRYSLEFQVAYDTDVPAMLDIVRTVVQSHPQVLNDPDLPIEERADAEIKRFADSGIEILVEFWMIGIDDGRNRVGADLLLMIWEAFRENGIRFPFPQREIRVLRTKQPQ